MLFVKDKNSIPVMKKISIIWNTKVPYGILFENYYKIDLKEELDQTHDNEYATNY